MSAVSSSLSCVTLALLVGCGAESHHEGSPAPAVSCPVSGPVSYTNIAAPACATGSAVLALTPHHCPPLNGQGAYDVTDQNIVSCVGGAVYLGPDYLGPYDVIPYPMQENEEPTPAPAPPEPSSPSDQGLPDGSA